LQPPPKIGDLQAMATFDVCSDGTASIALLLQRFPARPPSPVIPVITPHMPTVSAERRPCRRQQQRQQPTTERRHAATVSTSSRRNLHPVRQYRLVGV